MGLLSCKLACGWSTSRLPWVVAFAMLVGLVQSAALPLAAQTAAGWNPGPFAAAENTYEGYIDAPTNGASLSAEAPILVAGWVVDRAAQGWAGVDDLHVYLGKAGEGGTFLGRGLFAQSRPDVASVLGNPFWAASGFSFVVPANTLSPGVQTLSVYAHTPGKGWWYKQVSITVTSGAAVATQTVTSSSTPTASPARFPDDPLLVVLAPKPDERVGASRSYVLRGYTLDRNAVQGVGIDRVEIYIDGARDSTGGKLLGKAMLGQTYGSGADYGSQFAQAGFGLEFNPDAYGHESHTIFIYARSSETGKETTTTVTFRIVSGNGDADESD